MKDQGRQMTSGRIARLPAGGGERFRRFELKTPLANNLYGPAGYGSATAYQRRWDRVYSVWVTIVDSRAEFTVVGDLGLHRGRARGAFPYPNGSGSLGVARWDAETDRWLIVQMQPSALMIRGLTVAAFTTAAAQFSIDTVTLIQPIGAILTDQDPAGPIIVRNLYAWEADAGQPACAVWNEQGDGGQQTAYHWEAIQVKSPDSYP